MDIQKKIKDLCATKGWSPYELSKRAGISANTVYTWRNKTIYPTIPMLERICEAFQITLEQFFGGTDGELTQEERDLLEDWQSMSVLEKEAIKGLICTYKILRIKKSL